MKRKDNGYLSAGRQCNRWMDDRFASASGKASSYTEEDEMNELKENEREERNECLKKATAYISHRIGSEIRLNRNDEVDHNIEVMCRVGWLYLATYDLSCRDSH